MRMAWLHALDQSWFQPALLRRALRVEEVNMTKCFCDWFGSSMHGTPLCNQEYPDSDNIEVLTWMLYDSGFSVSRRQKHAIAAAIKKMRQLEESIANANMTMEQIRERRGGDTMKAASGFNSRCKQLPYV
jgi:hypothetical protein